MDAIFRKIPSPLIVSAVALATAAIVIGLAARARTGDVDPRVNYDFANSGTEARSADSPRQAKIVTTMEGEVARTADRIGEATALALAAGLLAVTEQINNRTPKTARDLLASLAAQNLLPPGLTISGGEGLLVSQHGSLTLRYRPLPLGIEVVAIGRAPSEGPPLLIRIPDETTEKGEARLYIANRLSGVQAPGPFAPAAEVIAMGWSPEPLHALK
ncbi:MAG: hypothetical protein ACKVX9_17270 [Blastocatellia bacterium]